MSFSHYRQLFKLNVDNEIDYYINKSINNSLSKRKLGELIKSKEYERLPEHTKNKLIAKEEINIGQIETYVNYIDETVKQINHNKTIGIIVSKLNNKYIIKYCTNPNIVFKEYLIK